MRLDEKLARFIRVVTAGTRYHAVYPCEVQGQADNGNLDLRPDDESMRGEGLQDVPVRHGLPGVTVRVPVGARVSLGFEEGNPRKPYAALWNAQSITSINFAGGDQPIARDGDSVVCYMPPGVAISGTLAGSPFSGFITILTPMTGIITSGQDKVRS